MNAKHCTVDGCSNPSRSRGHCPKHYKRLRLHGDASVVKRRPSGPCGATACDRQAIARGWCALHLQRIARCGDPTVAAKREFHGAKSGGKPTPEYVAWSNMRDRCNNRHSKNYPYYGGRGIRVCVEWDNFSAFLADVGPRPHPSLTIDRINVDGHYEPGNVRWATRAVQSRNRRQFKRGHR